MSLGGKHTELFVAGPRGGPDVVADDVASEDGKGWIADEVADELVHAVHQGGSSVAVALAKGAGGVGCLARGITRGIGATYQGQSASPQLSHRIVVRSGLPAAGRLGTFGVGASSIKGIDMCVGNVDDLDRVLAAWLWALAARVGAGEGRCEDVDGGRGAEAEEGPAEEPR